MTPQAKAKELIDKCQFVLYNNLPSLQSENFENAMTKSAKQCALIAVEEIIKANPIVPLTLMLESDAIDTAVEYWNEVKAEINKL